MPHITPLYRYRELIHAMMLGSSAKLAYLVLTPYLPPYLPQYPPCTGPVPPSSGHPRKVALIWEYPTEYELLVELFVLSSTVLALSGGWVGGCRPCLAGEPWGTMPGTTQPSARPSIPVLAPSVPLAIPSLVLQPCGYATAALFQGSVWR